MRVPFYRASMSVAEDRFAYFSDFPFPYELCGCLMRTVPSRFIVGQQVYSVPEGEWVSPMIPNLTGVSCPAFADRTARQSRSV